MAPSALEVGHLRELRIFSGVRALLNRDVPDDFPTERRQPMTILLIILIILALGGGGYGYRSGWYGGSRGTGFNGLGLLPLILIIVVVVLLFRGGF